MFTYVWDYKAEGLEGNMAERMKERERERERE
jgi:hypothetical protein